MMMKMNNQALQFQPLQRREQDYEYACMQTQTVGSCRFQMDSFSKDRNDSDDIYYREKRSQFIENFKNIEKTKEYGEKHYSIGCQKENFQSLVHLNGFYIDLVNHSITKGILKEDFLSSKFMHSINNSTEIIAVLALISLPNEAPVQEYKQFEGKGVEIITKQIKESKAQLRQDILIAQRFFDPKDRFIKSEDDPELQLENDITECLIDKIYGCKVIITNCSSTRADYQVLLELPNGAIPVQTVFYTKSFTINCQPYTTQRIEYFFISQKLAHFLLGQIVSVAQEGQLKVIEQKSIKNLEAIEDILAKGNKDDILNFLATKNIFNRNIFKAEDIRYLLKDKDFYLKVISIYRKRRFNDYETLKYSIYHADQQSMKELFLHNNCQELFNKTFKYFQCSLFEVNNIRMLEYYPLISKRVHKLTSEAKGILNVEFRNQYIDFLTYLVEKPKHSLSDKLGFIYYLLLQERINEAIQIYKTITEVDTQGEAILQYDYFTAYLDFYIGYPNFSEAREICEKYLNYPIIHWRNIFYDVANLLAEYDGDDDENQKLQTETTVKQKQTEQAKKEETLQSTIEGNQIQITYSNLNKVVIQFYKIDLEILYSRNPFLNWNEEDFAFVLLNSVLETTLEAQQQPGLTYKKSVTIPEELRKFNLIIQIKGISKRTSNRYYSTSLQVQIIENYGQIRVSDSEGKYLSKVYVKAYIKEKNGKELFYKDGYTDLREEDLIMLLQVHLIQMRLLNFHYQSQVMNMDQLQRKLTLLLKLVNLKLKLNLYLINGMKGQQVNRSNKIIYMNRRNLINVNDLSFNQQIQQIIYFIIKLMFEIITLNDVIGISATYLHNYQQMLIKIIKEKYEYRPLKNYGYCVKILGVKTSDGHIQDGDILYSVIIEILSFQPIQSELIYGKIDDQTEEGLTVKFLENNINKKCLFGFIPKDQLLNAKFDKEKQVWICCCDKKKFYYIKGEEIKFKVNQLNFDTADQIQQIIQGRMNEIGLGGVNWWI
ncbi:unnamed protein product [Paramecium sonneborni]|uniref:RNA polymerase III subunit Rpc25 domain-containing protein n=1 Tax=Paramecium sonneborni TaxID=65129 RepID=A0A8S1KH14_9CILI|nr:unnamed protein product [Paramecium sonneborni]